PGGDRGRPARPRPDGAARRAVRHRRAARPRRRRHRPLGCRRDRRRRPVARRLGSGAARAASRHSRAPAGAHRTRRPAGRIGAAGRPPGPLRLRAGRPFVRLTHHRHRAVAVRAVAPRPPQDRRRDGGAASPAVPVAGRHRGPSSGPRRGPPPLAAHPRAAPHPATAVPVPTRRAWTPPGGGAPAGGGRRRGRPAADGAGREAVAALRESRRGEPGRRPISTGGAVMTFWTDALGAQVRYRDAGEWRTRSLEAGDEGDHVIMMGGLTGHVEGFIRNVVPLAQRGLRVYAIDCLGHGYTAKPDNVTYHAPIITQHLLRFMDSIGAERAHIVGQSLGGWIGLWTAKEHPDRIGRIVFATGAGILLDDEARKRESAEIHSRVQNVTRRAVEE